MPYWLTTHYPHQSPSHPYNVYLKEKYRNKEVRVGDGVVFYELKGKRGKGRQAIVAIAHVCADIQPNPHRDSEEDMGDQIWEWQLPCDPPEFGAEIDKTTAYKILGWNERRSPLIPGGLVSLSAEQFEKFETTFRAGISKKSQ